MAIDLASDLTEMLSSDDFGTAATYNAATVYGIFTEEYLEQDVGTAGISSTEPVFYAHTSALSGLSDGDTITISSTDYTVAHFEADGEGLTRVVLNG